VLLFAAAAAAAAAAARGGDDCSRWRLTLRLHTRTVASLQADATRALSLLTARSVTSPWWPRQVRSSRPVCMSQICSSQVQHRHGACTTAEPDAWKCGTS
jgi:hypothetical protein